MLTVKQTSKGGISTLLKQSLRTRVPVLGLSGTLTLASLLVLSAPVAAQQVIIVNPTVMQPGDSITGSGTVKFCQDNSSGNTFDCIVTDDIGGGDPDPNSVGSGEVIDGSLTAADLGANSVGASEIAAGAVGASEIADGSVGAAEIGTNAVGASELADNSVDAGAVQAGAIGSSEVADGSLTADDLGTGTQQKLEAMRLARMNSLTMRLILAHFKTVLSPMPKSLTVRSTLQRLRTIA